MDFYSLFPMSFLAQVNTEKHGILSSLPAVLPSLQPVGLAWHTVYKPHAYHHSRGVKNRWSFRPLPTKAVLWFILWHWQLGTKMFWVLDSNLLCPLPSTAWHCRCKNSLGISLFRSKVSYILQFNSTQEYLETSDCLHLLLSCSSREFGPSPAVR